jgi:hypothetical protein
VLPLAGTAMVVNIGPTEAKVSATSTLSELARVAAARHASHELASEHARLLCVCNSSAVWRVVKSFDWLKSASHLLLALP